MSELFNMKSLEPLNLIVMISYNTLFCYNDLANFNIFYYSSIFNSNTFFLMWLSSFYKFDDKVGKSIQGIRFILYADFNKSINVLIYVNILTSNNITFQW